MVVNKWIVVVAVLTSLGTAGHGIGGRPVADVGQPPGADKLDAGCDPPVRGSQLALQLCENAETR